jgi:DNA-binding transcriptional LysR family regulator
MRLRHIEVFNAIMIDGTVSGAAKLINFSQPAVGRLLEAVSLGK